MFASKFELPPTATLVVYAEMYGHEDFDIDRYLDAQAEPLIMLMEHQVAEVQIEFTIDTKKDLRIYVDWKRFVDSFHHDGGPNVPSRSWQSKKKKLGDKEMTLFVRRAA